MSYHSSNQKFLIHHLFNVYIFFFIYLLFFSQSAYGQVSNDTILASKLFNKGDSLVASAKFKESFDYFDQSLKLYTKAHVWEKVASCLNSLSSAYWNDSQFNKALDFSEKAMKICNQHLPTSHLQSAVSFFNRGRYYYRIAEHKKSIEDLKKTIEILRNISPLPEKIIGSVYNSLANNYNDISQYNTAIKYFKKAIKVKIKVLGKNHINVGISYNNIGIAYENLGEFDKSIKYYQDFLDIVLQNYNSDHTYAAYAYLNIGNTYNQLMKIEKAKNNFNKALSIFLKEDVKFGILKANHGLGNVFLFKGQFHKAINHFEQSIYFSNQLYGKKDPNNGYNFLNIGSSFSNLGDFNNAVINYKKALEIFQASYDENHKLIAMTYASIADVYLKEGLLQDGLNYYQKSHQIFKKLLKSPHKELAKGNMDFASYYFELKDFNSAIIHQKQAIKELSESTGTLSFNTAKAYNKLGKYYFYNKDYISAEKALDSALLANSNLKKNTSKLSSKQHQNGIVLLTSLSLKAKILFKLYKKKHNLKLLQKSLVYLAEADHTIDTIRSNYINYEDKLILSKKSKQIYQAAIDYSNLYANKTNNHTYYQKAFYYSEKSKSTTLKELLTSQKIKKIRGLPKELIETEKNLRSNYAFYQSSITNEQSKAGVDSLKIDKYKNQLFKIRRKQDSITFLLKRKYPKYYSLKFKSTNISLAEIQKKLSESQTFIEYFTTDNIIYSFVITKNNFQISKIKNPKISKIIQQFKNTIIAKNTVEFKNISNNLYQTIIQPIEEQFIGNELIIVPDGPLWHINFDLLLYKKDLSNNPKELSYLLKKYAVSYANSANLLFNSFKNKAKKSTQKNECLAFSFTDTTNFSNSNQISLANLRNSKNDLPGTRKEIKCIANIIDGQYYYGANAIESNFKKHADQFNIIHLALHGDVDNENPENSKLYFTKSKDTLEDNLLYSHELFAMNIPSELTVLSACNTGTGKIAKGEGIMSLGNAFQYAGTKSLLLTNWEVSDTTTPKLMEMFYKNLKTGMNKAKALQQAKIQYINTSDINRISPFYWGSFYLVGDTEPIQFNTHLLWLKIIGLTLIVILSIYIILRYIKKK